MWFYLLTAAVVLHTCFWGAGIAWLAVPRRWRRWAWVFAPGFGIALQSAVVWAGAYANMPGVQSWAWASELIPLLLLGWAWRRAGRGWASGWREAAGALAIALVAGVLWLWPMARAARAPTALSLGSCDAADYAAGARALGEFARCDHTGFMGLPEVTKVRSVDFFYDFWLRLNHFTPSALLAHDAAILHSPVGDLVSLMGVAFGLLAIPPMLFLARLALGLRGWPLLLLTALLPLSPLQTYAVDHTALGQLLAVQGILLLTIAVLGAVRLRRARALGGVAVAGFWILAGGYNMILPVCLAPAGGWLLARLAWRRDVGEFGRVVGLLAAALAACVVLFWERFAGIAERFSLFDQYNFGWVVPRLTPESWLGLVAGPTLQARGGGVQVMLLGLVLAGWAGAAIWLRARSRARAIVAVMFVVPVAVGWTLLDRESHVRAHASYDAYKLVAVFQGVLLVGLGAWLVLVREGPRVVRMLAGCAAVALLAANLASNLQFGAAMAAAPLRLDRWLQAIAPIERDDRFSSLNLRIEDFWSRMWANVYLLRRPQYFVSHSYEGRLPTPLRGEWDLNDNLVRVLPADSRDLVEINNLFYLTRARARDLHDARFAEGWHAVERDRDQRWRWTAGDARIWVTNRAAQPLRVHVRLRVSAVSPRELVLSVNGRPSGTHPVGTAPQELDWGEVELPPGSTHLDLSSPVAPVVPGGGDQRPLSIAVYRWDLQSVRP